MPRYSDEATEINEGDLVYYRSQLLFWRWKQGNVSYVPGISTRHPEMEHNGLTWVGISGADGTFRGVLVDPNTQCLGKGIRFIERQKPEGLFGPLDFKKGDW